MTRGTGRKVVRTLRTLINRALVVVLCIPLVVGCYALWDSHTVTAHAEASQWQPYKPTEPEPLSFWELQRINPEVCAWLSVYGTNIEYPVCQAPREKPDKYLTADAKGEYSLSGALYIDNANASDFSDFSTIVYGHHMEHDVMFGQLTDFADKTFFDEHRYGNLFVNNDDHGLEFFGYLDADAYDTSIYRHDFQSTQDRQSYLDLLRSRARNWRDSVATSPANPIVLLSTCASATTNGRGILVGNLCNQTFENPFVKIPNFGTGIDAQAGLFGIPVWCWMALVALVGLSAALILEKRRRANA